MKDVLEKKVEVELMGPFREFSREKRVSVPVDEKVSLMDFVERLSRLFGQGFKNRVIDERTRQLNSDQSLVIVNGRIVDPSVGTSYEVKPGDRVVFALPLTGGG